MNASFPQYHIGHFINRPDQPLDFAILEFGSMEEPDVEDPHRHTFYEVIWVDSGVSTQRIDDQTYTIGPGTLFFISPHQVHQFEEWQSLQGGSLMFTETFFLLNQASRDALFEVTFLDNLYIRPDLRPGPDAYAEIRHTISLMIGEARRPDALEAILQPLLHVLTAQIQRHLHTHSPQLPARQPVLLYKRLKALIELHFSEGLGPGSYAELLHVTPHHLNRAVQAVAGKTTRELIQDRRMLEAKRLLAFTAEQVSSVAAALGYYDLSYFSKAFKAATGQTPQEFRQAMSGIYPNQQVPS